MKDFLFDFLNSITEPVLYRKFLNKRKLKDILQCFRNKNNTQKIDEMVNTKSIKPIFSSIKIDERRKNANSFE